MPSIGINKIKEREPQRLIFPAKAVTRKCLTEMVKFSTYIKIILPGSWGPRSSVAALWSSALATAVGSSHSEAHLRTSGVRYQHTLCQYQSRLTAHFTAACSADVWPAKLQYRQRSFGPHCFGSFGSERQAALSAETFFSGQEIFFCIFSTLGTWRPLCWALIMVKFGLLHRCPETYGVTHAWVVRINKDNPSHLRLTDMLCPGVIWEGDHPSYHTGAAAQPWSARTSLSHGL